MCPRLICVYPKEKAVTNAPHRPINSNVPLIGTQKTRKAILEQVNMIMNKSKKLAMIKRALFSHLINLSKMGLENITKTSSPNYVDYWS